MAGLCSLKPKPGCVLVEQSMELSSSAAADVAAGVTRTLWFGCVCVHILLYLKRALRGDCQSLTGDLTAAALTPTHHGNMTLAMLGFQEKWCSMMFQTAEIRSLSSSPAQLRTF
jgi:hypothetical protein